MLQTNKNSCFKNEKKHANSRQLPNKKTFLNFNFKI